MENNVAIVTQDSLEFLCKNHPIFTLRKRFDVTMRKFILSIEKIEYDGRISVICSGFEKQGKIHFTYPTGPMPLDFFHIHGVLYQFDKTEDAVLNYPIMTSYLE